MFSSDWEVDIDVSSPFYSDYTLIRMVSVPLCVQHYPNRDHIL